MIFWIISAVFSEGALKIRVKLFNPPIKSGILTEVIVAKRAPPKVMIAEGAFIYSGIIFAKPALLIRPYTIITKQKRKPIKDAKSTGIT